MLCAKINIGLTLSRLQLGGAYWRTLRGPVSRHYDDCGPDWPRSPAPSGAGGATCRRRSARPLWEAAPAPRAGCLRKMARDTRYPQARCHDRLWAEAAQHPACRAARPYPLAAHAAGHVPVNAVALSCRATLPKPVAPKASEHRLLTYAE